VFNKGLGEGQRGAALIEAAMVLPLLLLMTFGIWATARAWNVNSTMEHAAREAARYGATLDPWDSSSSAAVRTVADGDMSSSSMDTTVVGDCIELLSAGITSVCNPLHTNTTNTNQVYVRLTYDNYPLNFLFFSADVDMAAAAGARFEATP